MKNVFPSAIFSYSWSLLRTHSHTVPVEMIDVELDLEADTHDLKKYSTREPRSPVNNLGRNFTGTVTKNGNCK